MELKKFSKFLRPHPFQRIENQNCLTLIESICGEIGEVLFFISIILISFQFLCLPGAMAQDVTPTSPPKLREIFFKNLDTPIQNVDLSLNENSSLHFVSVQTKDKDNLTSLQIFDGDGKLVNEKKCTEGESLFLLPDGKRMIESEKWNYIGAKKLNFNGKTEVQKSSKSVVRSIRTEDFDGTLLKNVTKTEPLVSEGNHLFSNDYSLCFVDGVSDLGSGYALYDGNGNLILKGPEGSEAHHVTFSPGNKYIGFFVDKKFVLLNQKGEKAFDFSLDSFGNQIQFTTDGSKIIILSFESFYVFNMNGNEIIKTSLPANKKTITRFRCLNNGELVFSDVSKIWLSDLNWHFKLIKDFQDLRISHFDIVGQNIILNVGSQTKGSSLVLLGFDGNVLASKDLPSHAYGISTVNNSFVVWGRNYINVFQAE